MGTHLKVLNESFPMNTNRVQIVFKNIRILVHWTKLALALEGLKYLLNDTLLICYMTMVE